MLYSPIDLNLSQPRIHSESRAMSFQDIGRQYGKDDAYMAAARLHQSKYRANVLKIPCDVYGNMLNDSDAEKLLIYYDNLGVREEVRKRYPKYSKKRDANMLRSEHIPLNMFAPLISRKELAKDILQRAFGLKIREVLDVKIEYAPEPKSKYLDDNTSFDAYVKYIDIDGVTSGLGIEIKYTEHSYLIGSRERENVENPKSKYWHITTKSNIYRQSTQKQLATDDMRQIWRNHLLGLSMQNSGDISKFTTATLYPSGNTHFTNALGVYHSLLIPEKQNTVIGCTYEKFIDVISGDEEILAWKKYLSDRYIVNAEDYNAK